MNDFKEPGVLEVPNSFSFYAEPEDPSVWKDFFDSIKKLDEAENLRKVYSVQPERRAKIKRDKLLQLFKKIHSIFAVIQDWGEENGRQIEGYYLPGDFNNLTVGKKLATEIRKEINAQNNPFFMWINEKLSEIEKYKNDRAEIVKGQFFSEFVFVALSQSKDGFKKIGIHFEFSFRYKIEFRDIHFGRLLFNFLENIFLSSI